MGRNLKFKADFHIHSRHSIATSRDLDFENLYIAAQLKGLTVVGTGDMTHPQWLAEAGEKLVPAEAGLYRLREDIAGVCDERVPARCRAPVRFILTSEISNIYKKGGRTRKNHNLVFLPDLETAAVFSGKLDRIGNIKADGRPILGLDARNLLEVVLETSDQAFLVPAHIWTPWFSVLGSKSGFDRLSECFDDLTGHIFAVETGLSSDPAMNWRVSDLDGLTLISNSDAHSPMKLAREANLLDTELGYPAIRSALENGRDGSFLGTLEFFPEEGKYHMDGHRKCRVCLTPPQTLALGGRCPKCGRPLTLGVLHRVEELADREKGEKPEGAAPFTHLVPLTDLLSEILKVGPNTKRVSNGCREVLSALGSELTILHEMPVERIQEAGFPLLAEAVRRVRLHRIQLAPGYDGEFGKVRIFDAAERERLSGQKSLFDLDGIETPDEGPATRTVQDQGPERFSAGPTRAGGLADQSRPAAAQPPAGNDRPAPAVLNGVQLQAVRHPGGPLMIVAGPGTGKTLTLTRRIAHLILDKQVPAERILAVTFTHKAAREMRDRLRRLLADPKVLPTVSTFHSLCVRILSEQGIGGEFSVVDGAQQASLVRDAVKLVKRQGHRIQTSVNRMIRHIERAGARMDEERMKPGSGPAKETPDAFDRVFSTYRRILALQNLLDYDDLLMTVVRGLEEDAAFRGRYRRRYPYVFVDEYQDLNQAKYRMVRALSPSNGDLCVIGDPDQAIYGFRGADVTYFARFAEDYPGATLLRLTRNYRSTDTILKASGQVIRRGTDPDPGWRLHSGIQGVKTIGILGAATDRSEPVAVGKRIERMVGGTGFHALDFGVVDGYDTEGQRNFSDFAVLFRTGQQIDRFAERFEKAGIPYQVSSRAQTLEQGDAAGLLSLFRIVTQRGTYTDVDAIAGGLAPGLSKKAVESFKLWGYAKALPLGQAMEKAATFPVPGMTRRAQETINAFTSRVEELAAAVSGSDLPRKLEKLVRASPFFENSRQDPASDPALSLLLRMAEGFDEDERGFLAAVALATDGDVLQPDAEKVALMTIHAAKGLEFPVVFVAGCEEGFLPMEPRGDRVADPDEEKRLFFVAMTRAKEELYLTYAAKRQIHGRLVRRRISPFVAAIEAELVRGEAAGGGPRKTPRQTQLTLFEE